MLSFEEREHFSEFLSTQPVGSRKGWTQMTSPSLCGEIIDSYKDSFQPSHSVVMNTLYIHIYTWNVYIQWIYTFHIWTERNILYVIEIAKEENEDSRNSNAGPYWPPLESNVITDHDVFDLTVDFQLLTTSSARSTRPVSLDSQQLYMAFEIKKRTLPTLYIYEIGKKRKERFKIVFLFSPLNFFLAL